MMPTQDYLDQIAAVSCGGTFQRSHAGSIVKTLIAQLQDRRVNVTEGTIEAGVFLGMITLSVAPLTDHLTTLAQLASFNVDGVVWGWRLDPLARIHFAPLDHLPQG